MEIMLHNACGVQRDDDGWVAIACGCQATTSFEALRTEWCMMHRYAFSWWVCTCLPINITPFGAHRIQFSSYNHSILSPYIPGVLSVKILLVLYKLWRNHKSSHKFAALQDVAHAVLLEEGFFLLQEDVSKHLVRINVRLTLLYNKELPGRTIVEIFSKYSQMWCTESIHTHEFPSDHELLAFIWESC